MFINSCEKKFKSKFHRLISRTPKSGHFLGSFIAEQVLKSFVGRSKLRTLIRFWVNRHLKMQKILPIHLFFDFLAATIGLLIILKY